MKDNTTFLIDMAEPSVRNVTVKNMTKYINIMILK